MSTERRRVVILGAAGRDFHVFNTVYRDDPSHEVVAFTATQIPGIDGRRYPPELAGPLYPQGIPIEDEASLEELCRRERVDEVVFAYSDVPHEHVMHLASRANAVGADFVLHGPGRTMLRSKLPVISICAVRTGCGKSQISHWLTQYLRERGRRPGVLRHPMPYGDLARQSVQRFATMEDLDRAECTAEEREEYEPHIERGGVIFAGVDYARILAEAEKESDIIVWEGGNNDLPFIEPDLEIAVADALRPGHVTTHHPGEAVARRAHVIVINKADAAEPDAVARLAETLREVNPRARILRANSPVTLDDEAAVRGRRVLVVEDGPTVTHGGMPTGAGYAAATAGGAAEIVDPRPFAAPEIARTYERYPHIGPVLPAMGYGPHQIEDLRATIERCPADVVVAGTPIDLARLVRTSKPVVRARYRFAEAEEPGLEAVVREFLER
ncbi:MAG: GTPase [Acidobacteria bacterium]|nr:MAG: GTPase [Acidobacteriota bacterium]